MPRWGCWSGWRRTRASITAPSATRNSPVYRLPPTTSRWSTLTARTSSATTVRQNSRLPRTRLSMSTISIEGITRRPKSSDELCCKSKIKGWRHHPWSPYWRGRLCTIDLLVLTFFRSAAFFSIFLPFYLFTKSLPNKEAQLYCPIFYAWGALSCQW